MKKTYQQPTVEVIILEESLLIDPSGPGGHFVGKENRLFETEENDDETPHYHAWDD